jgi:hypothetical protein
MIFGVVWFFVTGGSHRLDWSVTCLYGFETEGQTRRKSKVKSRKTVGMRLTWLQMKKIVFLLVIHP